MAALGDGGGDEGAARLGRRRHQVEREPIAAVGAARRRCAQRRQLRQRHHPQRAAFRTAPTNQRRIRNLKFGSPSVYSYIGPST